MSPVLLTLNLVWIYLVLNAAPWVLMFPAAGCRWSRDAGSKWKRVASFLSEASGWWCHSMSSLTLFLQIIVSRLLRSSLCGSRASPWHFGVKLWEGTAPPLCPGTWCSLTGVRRHCAIAQMSWRVQIVKWTAWWTETQRCFSLRFICFTESAEIFYSAL